MIIVLPWPDKRLNPNGRAHWHAVAKAKKRARGDGYIAALDAMSRQGWLKPVQFAKTQITFFHKLDKRHRDGDNHLAMLKAYFDGFADAGVIVNDSGFMHQPIRFAASLDRRVEVEIIPIEIKEAS
jgi:Holliday junction resolvase RusA-like endonuclease